MAAPSTSVPTWCICARVRCPGRTCSTATLAAHARPPPASIAGWIASAIWSDWLYLDAPHPSFYRHAGGARAGGRAARRPSPDPPRPGPPVAHAAFTGGPAAFEAAEFLFDSPMIPNVPEARDYAARSFPAERPILAGLLDLNARIRRDFRFSRR